MKKCMRALGCTKISRARYAPYLAEFVWRTRFWHRGSPWRDCATWKLCETLAAEQPPPSWSGRPLLEIPRAVKEDLDWLREFTRGDDVAAEVIPPPVPLPQRIRVLGNLRPRARHQANRQRFAAAPHQIETAPHPQQGDDEGVVEIPEVPRHGLRPRARRQAVRARAAPAPEEVDPVPPCQQGVDEGAMEALEMPRSRAFSKAFFARKENECGDRSR